MPLVVARVFLGLTIAVIGVLIPDPTISWVHPEVSCLFWFNALRFDLGFSLTDFIQSFNYWDFDRISRPRFLSTFFQIATVHTRLILFDWIPTLPSFSLTWIFSLVLTPAVIYAIVMKLVQNKSSAVLASAVFLLSVANLSSLAMWFHPGKPLAVFFTGLAILYALKAAESKNASLPLAIVFLSAWASFLSDEKGWFVVAAVPVLAPSFFLKESETDTKSRTLLSLLKVAQVRWGVLTAWVLSFGLFIGTVAFLFPPYLRSLGIPDFNFFQFATPGGSLEKFQLSALLQNFELIWRESLSLTSLAILKWGSGWAEYRDSLGRALLGALALSLWGFARLMPKEVRAIATNFLWAAFLFIVFHAIVQAKYAPVQGSYYYGSLFALFSSCFLGVVLGSERVISAKVLVAIVIMASSVMNFTSANRAQRDMHRSWAPGQHVHTGFRLAKDSSLGRELWWKLWTSRHSPEKLAALRPSLPLEGVWLVQELEMVDLRRRGMNVVRGRPTSDKNPDDAFMVADIDERSGWSVGPKEPSALVSYTLPAPTNIEQVRLRIDPEIDREIRVVARSSPSEPFQTLRARIAWPWMDSHKQEFVERIKLPEFYKETVTLSIELDPDSVASVEFREWGIELGEPGRETQSKTVRIYDLWAYGKAPH